MTIHNFEPIDIGQYALAFHGEPAQHHQMSCMAITAAFVNRESGEIREQTLFYGGDEYKDLAPRWRETAERKLRRMVDEDLVDYITPLVLVPSADRQS